MKSHDSQRGEVPISDANKPEDSSDLGALFDAHIKREFVDRDVEATMQTMVPEPYVYNIPSMTGGFGSQGLRRFYSEHFVSQIQKDAEVTRISRTIGKDQVVDELIVSFTHDTQWDYLLPGIPPTGKRVELPHVVVMRFENGKIAHELFGGTRLRCSCKWDCWIQRTYRLQASTRPENFSTSPRGNSKRPVESSLCRILSRFPTGVTIPYDNY